MAVINPCGFLQNAGATHTAEQMRNWHGLIIAGKMGATSLLPRGGVNPALGNALSVTQTGSPSMAVLVKSGHATIPGSEGTKQGVYSVMNDADVTLSIAAAHATLNRIDIVCFKVEDQAFSGSVNSSSLVVVTGTPAGSPSAPAAPNNSITLAQVSIVANDTSITNNEITDKRQYMTSLGGLLSVADATEESGLTVYDSLAVWRRDLDVIDVYDSGGAAYKTFYPKYRVDQILGSTTATITFSSIPSNLKTLRVYWTARGNNASNQEHLRMRVNNSSSAVYFTQTLQNNGTTVTGQQIDSSGTSHFCGHVVNNSTATNFSDGEIIFPGWNVTYGKMQHLAKANNFSNANALLDNTGGMYAAAGPYTRLDFFLANSASFVSGTQFRLEGDFA